jgi:hypothetical protein
MPREDQHNPDPNENAARIVAESTRMGEPVEASDTMTSVLTRGLSVSC